jgi:hypothetical protein
MLLIFRPPSGVWPEPAPTVPTGSCGTDVVAQGLAFLTRTLRAHAAQPILYVRDGLSVEACATFGTKPLRVNDAEGGGVRLEATNVDFLIPAEDFAFAGEPVVPRRGDRITVVVGGVPQLYEVTAYFGFAPWQWSDPNQTMMRVHAKHLGAAS